MIRRVVRRSTNVGALVALVILAFPVGSAFAHASSKSGGGTQTGTMTCTMTNSGLAAQVLLSGSGYKPGVTYGIAFSVNGESLGLTSSMANASGQIFQATWARSPGTYKGLVYSGRTTFATCSTVVP